jgi:hypothetical protein
MIRRTGLLIVSALAVAASGCFGGGDGEVIVEEEQVFLDTYEPCEVTEQCVPSDLCLEITTDVDGRFVTDAICTHECFDDLDCPISVNGLGGACIDIGSGLFCYEGCIDDLDCPAGFACLDTFQASVCLPL